jgi:hypothetical protein
MLTGDKFKTTNYALICWWESASEAKDMQTAGKVGSWIGQSAKALDKKRAPEVVQLIKEQFPELAEIEAQHVQLRWARL